MIIQEFQIYTSGTYKMSTHNAWATWVFQQVNWWVRAKN